VPHDTPGHLARPHHAALFRVDPGWLFLVAGCVMISATVLVPAQDDLLEAHAFRDKALALESYRASVLSKHTSYLQAIDAGDTTVLLDLAATQLNLVPTTQTVLLAPTIGSDAPASVLAALDVPYTRPAPPVAPDTILRRLTLHPRARMLIFAASAVAILYGLLPPSTQDSVPRESRRRPRPHAAPTPSVRPIAPVAAPARTRSPIAPRPAASKSRPDSDGRAA
jgi:hypothetical protein